MFNLKPSFRFEINNLPENRFTISSPTFISGGCQWFLKIYPIGNGDVHDYVSLYLSVADSNTLRTGWKRIANFNFVIRNQSEKVLYRSLSDTKSLFRAEYPTLGFFKTLAHSKIEEEWEKLIIEVYINVVETFDGEGGDESKKKKTVDINGFQVLDSQVTSVKKIFEEHPDIAEDFKPKNQEIKTAYMNVLHKVIERLQKPPKSISESNISDDVDRSRIQQLEGSVELLLKIVSDLKVELEKKQDKSNNADGFMLVDEVDDL